jgi:hypothetical protein
LTANRIFHLLIRILKLTLMLFMTLALAGALSLALQRFTYSDWSIAVTYSENLGYRPRLNIWAVQGQVVLSYYPSRALTPNEDRLIEVHGPISPTLRVDAHRHASEVIFVHELTSFGFGVGRSFDDDGRLVWVMYYLPWWLPAIGLAIPSALYATLMVRRRRQASKCVRAGRCVACGYDLRASPDRCPECGTVSSHSGSSNPANDTSQMSKQ